MPKKGRKGVDQRVKGNVKVSLKSSCLNRHLLTLCKLPLFKTGTIAHGELYGLSNICTIISLRRPAVVEWPTSWAER